MERFMVFVVKAHLYAWVTLCNIFWPQRLQFRHFIPAYSCYRWDMGVGRQNNLLRTTKPWSQLIMPKFIVYAGILSHDYIISEHFIIEFQIKILVEMIHHFTEPDFYFVFLSFSSLQFFSFNLPIFYYIPHCCKRRLLVHFSTVPLIWCLLLIQIP